MHSISIISFDGLEFQCITLNVNPQPDNFTTCGRLGIEVNQYNNPIECYADETIEDMREEKVIVDHPELADKLVKANTQVGGSLLLIIHTLLH